MLGIKEVHPDYQFDPEVKKLKYKVIIKSLDTKKVRRAASFPGLSNYRFERMLEKNYPGIKIDCFEKEASIHDDIKGSFKKPKSVSLFNETAEDHIRSFNTIYDVIFFDYCGGPHEDISALIDEHLSENGVFAITEFKGRGFIYPPFRASRFTNVIAPADYGHMRFQVYRKYNGRVNLPSGFTYIDLKKVHNRGRSQFQELVSEASRLKKEMSRVEKEMRRLKVNPSKGNGIELAKETTKPVFSPSKELVESEKDKEFRKILSEFSGLFVFLPEKERGILDKYYFKKMPQTDIARMTGMTQGAISQKLSRAKERLKFLSGLPTFTSGELQQLRESFDPQSVELFTIMASTTCQSETAKILNKRFKLSGNRSYNQVKVRYRWKCMMEKLKTVSAMPRYKYLSKFYKFMGHIESNLYILHEVRLPHLEKLQRERMLYVQPSDVHVEGPEDVCEGQLSGFVGDGSFDVSEMEHIGDGHTGCDS